MYPNKFQRDHKKQVHLHGAKTTTMYRTVCTLTCVEAFSWWSLTSIQYCYRLSPLKPLQFPRVEAVHQALRPSTNRWILVILNKIKKSFFKYFHWWVRWHTLVTRPCLFPQKKFLGNEVAPTFAIIVRAIKADKVLGYKLAVYLDKLASRLQVILASLATNDNWKLCADGVLLSKHKVTVKHCLVYIIDLRT